MAKREYDVQGVGSVCSNMMSVTRLDFYASRNAGMLTPQQERPDREEEKRRTEIGQDCGSSAASTLIALCHPVLFLAVVHIGGGVAGG
jgi:hypothetical protein